MRSEVRGLFPEFRSRATHPGLGIRQHACRVHPKMPFSVLYVRKRRIRDSDWYWNGFQNCNLLFNRFAALMNGQQCYCISKFGQDGPSNGCTVPCASDPSNYCGSYEAMSVYATGQQGMSDTNLLFYVMFIMQRIAHAKCKAISDVRLIH